MADYVAPTRDISFVMNEMLDYSRINAIETFSEATTELTEAILDEAGKFAQEVFAPLNRVGDQQGVRVENDTVVTDEMIMSDMVDLQTLFKPAAAKKPPAIAALRLPRSSPVWHGTFQFHSKGL